MQRIPQPKVVFKQTGVIVHTKHMNELEWENTSVNIISHIFALCLVKTKYQFSSLLQKYYILQSFKYLEKYSGGVGNFTDEVKI